MSRAKLAEAPTEEQELVEVPTEEETLDHDQAVQEALPVLGDAGLDVSGYAKARRVAIKAQITNATINAEQLRLLAAVGPIRSRYAELGDPLAGYRTTGLRPPADLLPLEAERMALQPQLHALDSAFLAGAERLQAAAVALQAARIKARHALTGTLRTYCTRLGARARDLVSPRLEFFRRFPHQIPAEALDLLQQAGDLAGLGDRIDDQHPGLVLEAFELAAGEVVWNLLRRAAGFADLTFPIDELVPRGSDAAALDGEF